jgi:hypothetical protein
MATHGIDRALAMQGDGTPALAKACAKDLAKKRGLTPNFGNNVL